MLYTLYRTIEYQSLYYTLLWNPYYKIKLRLQNNQNKLLDLLRIIFLCWRSRTFWFCHSFKQKLHLYFSPFNYLAFNRCAKNMRHSRKSPQNKCFDTKSYWCSTILVVYSFIHFDVPHLHLTLHYKTGLFKGEPFERIFNVPIQNLKSL